MGDNVKEYGAQQRGGHKKHQRQFGVDGKGQVRAMSIITGERNAGRMPVDTEFWMVVTSLVSRVTREEVRNLSVLAKENCCSV